MNGFIVLLRDEQEIRDCLEALETAYIKSGLNENKELTSTDPRIMMLRWVLLREQSYNLTIDELIKHWKEQEKQTFGIQSRLN